MEPRLRIALLPWGNAIEDYLDPLGVSIDDFCREPTGSWMFAYAQALSTAGVETLLVCVSRSVRAVERRRHAPTGTAITFLPHPRVYARARAVVGYSLGAYVATPPRALVREVRRSGCRAILVQEYENPRFDVCIAAGRLAGVPVFATFQGSTVQYSPVERPLRPLALRGCAGFIVPTALEAARIEAKYEIAPGRIASIPNPLPLGDWAPGGRAAARRALGLPEDAVVAVWHGRVEVIRKGLDVLVEAWERVSRAHPDRDLRLLLVGTGEDRERLTDLLASRDVRGVHRVDDFVRDRTVLRRHLAAADFYCFPSRREGFPLAPLEGMASGLGVVAAAANGVPDIFAAGEQDGGIVVPAGDVAAFADAVDRLIADPALRERLGRAARRRVETAFAPDVVGRRLRDALTSDPRVLRNAA